MYTAVARNQVDALTRRFLAGRKYSGYVVAKKPGLALTRSSENKCFWKAEIEVSLA